uniref:Peptidase S1 domain-containing protein n=1 Tax=Glossina brevipalpis TaxID=37001 RepID=A0A1A9WGX3_9MUSC
MWCQIVKEDLKAPAKRYVRESWNIITFKDETHREPWSMPQLQVLVLDAQMVFARGKHKSDIFAESINLNGKPFESKEQICKVHTIDQTDGINTIVERKVIIVGTSDCTNEYGTLLDPDVICIKMNDTECNHCDVLKPGSALVCEHDNLIGVVSEFAANECNKDKSGICADIYELRNWIKHTMANETLASTDYTIETQRVGLIVSNNCILTAFVSKSKRMWCQVVKEDHTAPTGSFIRESWNIITLEKGRNDEPWKSAQLAILVLDEQMIYKSNGSTPVIITEAISIPYQSFDSNGSLECKVHTLNNENKTQEITVTIVNYEECNEKYGNALDTLVLCIRGANGCNHCKDLQPGSGLVCNKDLIGIVSEQNDCTVEKPRICANVYELRPFNSLSCIPSASLNSWISGNLCEESVLDSGACTPGASKFAKALALVKCQERGMESTRLGAIISNHFILTSSILPEDKVTCEVIYKNISAPEELHTRETWSIQNYLGETNLKPEALPQLQLLKVDQPIILEEGVIIRTTLAKILHLAKKPLSKDDECTLHTTSTIGEEKQIVEYKATIIEREACEGQYGSLHENVICIKVPDGCDNCKDVMPGSALIQKGRLIGTKLQELYNDYASVLILIRYETGECTPGTSKFAKSLAIVTCTQVKENRESIRLGVIISYRFILTSGILPEAHLSCKIKYNINKPKDRYTRGGSYIAKNYEDEINLKPESSPQLLILEPQESIVFKKGRGITIAEKLELAKDPLRKDDEYTLHTIRTIAGQEQIVEYKPNIVERKECEESYDCLDENVICIKMPDGCDNCKDVMPGSALIQKGHLIGTAREYKGARVRGYEDTRVRGYESTKVRGYVGMRLHGYENTNVRRYECTGVRWYVGMRLQEYEDTRIRGYEGTRIRGYEDTRIGRYEDTRVRRYKGTKVREYEDARVQGYNGTRIQEYEDTRKRRYEAEAVWLWLSMKITQKQVSYTKTEFDAGGDADGDAELDR